MRKIRDVLRLKLDAKLTHRQIAAALGVVTKYVGPAAAAGLDWETVQAMDETALQRRLLAAPSARATWCNPTTSACTRSCAARA
jgi:citrate lyase synthetase